MAEYIDREAALNAQNKSMNLAECRKRIERLPAADVRPVVRGEWICDGYWSYGCGMGEEYGNYWKCNVCGEIVQENYEKCEFIFCPNCGARMDGET